MNVCIVTFWFPKAFVVPLSNLQEILSSLSENVYVITGSAENVITETSRSNVHSYRIVYSRKATNVFTRIVRYVQLQVEASLRLVKLSKKVDFCLFFMEAGPILPMLVAKFLRKKVVWTLPSSVIREGISVYVKNMCFRLSTRIVVYSDSLITAWGIEKYRAKILVGHEHFLDFNKFKIEHEITKRELLVGYIGRLDAEKGILNFVETIPKILQKSTDFGFLICGDGSLENKIEEYLLKNSLRETVKFLGWVSHDKIITYLNQLKILVVPSYTEGLPNIILEAMACGTPILAMPVGVIPKIIKDGETGFLLERNDSTQIAERLLEIFNRPELLAEVSEKARAYVRTEFNKEAVVDSWRKLFQDVANGAANGMHMEQHAVMSNKKK